MDQEFGSGVAGWLRLRISHVAPVKMFEGLQMVKNLPANAGDTRDVGSIPGSGRSPGLWQPTPVFLPEKSHGQRSRAGSMGSQRIEHD